MYNNKEWKKIIINVFWDNHHGIFQMYIILTHLDLVFLTSASEFFWAHQGLGLLFLPKHFEISFSLLNWGNVCWRYLVEVYLKRKKTYTCHFDVLKNLDGVVTNLWQESSLFFSSFLQWIISVKVLVPMLILRSLSFLTITIFTST